MDFITQDLLFGALWYVVFVISTTCHEAAHALAALKLGDRTAYAGGQVTLDPLPHMRREPVGMIVVPILSYLLSSPRWMIGWASAPYDPSWAYQHPRRAALMALAGPAANLCLVLLAALAIRLGILFGLFMTPDAIGFLDMQGVVRGAADGVPSSLAAVVSLIFSLNCLLLTFNLLPLPPLDGSAAMAIVLKPRHARRYQELMREPMVGLIGLIAAWKFFAYLFAPLWRLAVRALYPEHSWL